MTMKVQESFTVQSFESDIKRRMKPFFMQSHVQELAYKGSAACGTGYADLRGRNLFWALNRIHLNIAEWPLWGDELCMQTWSRAKAGPLWHRNFKLFRPGSEEAPLMLGSSVWTILDLENRSICSDSLGFKEEYHIPEDSLPLCSKILIPRGLAMEYKGSHKVSYSELDSNSHANNCMYTQWAVDCLDFDYLASHRLRDLRIGYHKELHYGDSVDLLLGRDADEKWYLKGVLDGAVCFVVAMQFIPEPQQGR